MEASGRIIMPPDDEANQKLIEHTHPPDWVNPEPAKKYNLVVIGGGPAGLVAAVGGASLGAKVALVEKHLLGGDCLIYGCVPSKALIRCAKAAHDVRDAARFGVKVPDSIEVDFAAAMQHVRESRSAIAHHDAAERFRDLGIDVFLGEGKFTSEETIAVAGKSLRFSKAVVATGARALDPAIDGLADAGYLTNETVFDLTERPDRLIVVGAGPIGCELAQSFQRLGSQVTLIEMAPQILIREDPDAAKVVEESLVNDGVRIVTNAKVNKVTRDGDVRIVSVQSNSGVKEDIPCDELLIGIGRTPNVEGLELDTGGVKYDKRGIEVDDNLRTSNPKVYAAGDVCMEYKFTHTADAAAAIVLRNALFGFLPRHQKLSALTVPWATYTDPEIAHVGLNEAMANDQGIKIDTFVASLADNDRAVSDGETDGLVKVHVKKGSDEIVGATIVARHAGEMIGEITTAMVAGKGLGFLTGVIHPYPTQAEIIKRAAGNYRKTKLSPLVSRIMAIIMRLQR